MKITSIAVKVMVAGAVAEKAKTANSFLPSRMVTLCSLYCSLIEDS